MRSDRPRWAPHGAVLRHCALAAVTVIGLTACGNRLTKQEILAENTVHGVAAQTVSGQGPSTQQQSASSSTDVATGNASAGPEAQLATGVGAPERSSTAPSRAAAPAERSSTAPSPAAAPAGGSHQAASGTQAPIVVGFVGWLSGIGGTTVSPVRDAWVAWQRSVNARGGINGHPVQLLIGDDHGDAAQTMALIRQFVEQDHAIAMTLMEATLSPSIANYFSQHQVPLIGSGVFDPVWNDNPYLFPTYAAFTGKFTAAAIAAKQAGVTKVGTLYCVESSVCQHGNDIFVKAVKDLGLQVVYQGGMSITQPDYTADCLRLQQSGAQLVLPFTTNDSTVRVAQSCGRQAYRPIWEVETASDRMRQLSELNGALAIEPTFPWFLRSGSPAIEEYAQALQRYAASDYADGADGLSNGWISAKTFEKAAAHVSSRPTSQDILSGLWSMRGETLGGLLPGGMARTFVHGKSTPETYCVFVPKIENGEWTMPAGMAPTCK